MVGSFDRPEAASAISRRRFVQGMGTAGFLAGLGWPLRPVLGAPRGQVLSGSDFVLEIGPVPMNITGRPRTATGVNGSVPAPILRWREGDTITLAVTNRLSDPTSIHWHGVRTPSPMDGVPGLSFNGIAPGQTYLYRFPVHQSGTYWYHSHSAFQEQTGVYGAIIIEPRRGYEQAFDRDYVVLLSDWSDENPDTIVSNLKFQSDYYNFGQRTVGTFFADVAHKGFAATVSDRLEWGRMRMDPTDILDVTGATYTYLINGQPPAANWTALFRPGERVRLRFINGSSMSIFDVRIPDLPMTVVQADGNDVEPVTVDEFRIGTAETYDVIVQPTLDRAFTIFAQAEDRSGFARGTLAPRAGMAAAVPPRDPRPMRTIVDMGMGHMDRDHEDMGHHAMSGMAMDHAMPGMDHGSMSTMPMNHGAMAGAGMDHPAMSGMNMDHKAKSGMPMDHGTMPGMSMDHAMPGMAMDHGSMGMSGTMAATPSKLTKSVEVDNVAMMPTERVNDPGEGLDTRNRRVLAYTDLRALRPGEDPRPPSREITLHLTGNMERFIWGFDGKKFSEAEPIRLQRGERVRFVLINDSMMEHPIHLHGLWSELENGHGEFRPYKHTILVKPGERLSYLVTADEPGRWAYHCHLLYHMEMGMFREVRVA
jgi:FtsP/CotA-like multicopper oxidase with cupredoxin domain